MADQKKVAVQVELLPPASTHGTFSPVQAQAKTTADAVDQIGKRVKESMDVFARGRDSASRWVTEIQKVGQSNREIAALSQQLQLCGINTETANKQANRFVQQFGAGVKVATQDVQRLATAMKLNDPFAAANKGASGLLGRLGSMKEAATGLGSGLFAATRGLAMLSGQSSGFEQMMKTFLVFESISSIGRGIGQVGSSAMQVGGQLLGRGAATAATSVGGNALAAGVAGAAGTAAAPSAGGAAANVASGAGSVWRGAGRALNSGLGRGGILGLGAVAGGDIWRASQNGWDFRGGALDIMPEGMASGIERGTRWLPGRGDMGAGDVQRQQAATNRRLQMLQQRERMEQLAAREHSIREPFMQAQRNNTDQITAARGGADVYLAQVAGNARDAAFGRGIEALQLQQDRGQGPMATAAERRSGQQAQAQIRAQLLQDPGADAGAMANRQNALRQREDVGRQLFDQHRVVNAANADPTATVTARQQATERLLQLQQQMVAATNQEAQAERAVRESTTARLRERERMLTVTLQQARAEADSHRNETRSQGRSLAGMNALELRNIANIQGRLNRGEQLNQDETRFAQGVSVLQPRVNEMLDRRANDTPEIQQILQNAGRTAEQRRLDQNEREAGAAVNDVRGQADNNQQAAADQFARDVNSDVVPALEAAGRTIGQGLAQAIQRDLARSVIEHLQAFMQQQGAGANAAAGGGAP